MVDDEFPVPIRCPGKDSLFSQNIYWQEYLDGFQKICDEMTILDKFEYTFTEPKIAGKWEVHVGAIADKLLCANSTVPGSSGPKINSQGPQDTTYHLKLDGTQIDTNQIGLSQSILVKYKGNNPTLQQNFGKWIGALWLICWAISCSCVSAV